jgi:hypothetical protein
LRPPGRWEGQSRGLIHSLLRMMLISETVRVADETRIAQRFSAGRVTQFPLSPRSGRLRCVNFSRP